MYNSQKEKVMVTQENIKHLFDYSDGKLFWRSKPSKTSPIKLGSEAGTVMNDGYKRTHIYKQYYAIHRLIFLMHKGYLPKYIDHIDGNRLNNCIENLREATASQNGQNKKLPKNNTSGVKGVYFSKWNKWVAQLKIDNKVTYLGSFDDIRLAENAVKEARSKNHGMFAKHS
jgi:hypothetical protein